MRSIWLHYVAGLVLATLLAGCSGGPAATGDPDGAERNSPEAEVRALIAAGEAVPGAADDDDSAYLGVWEVAWDPDGLRGLSAGDTVAAFLRLPDDSMLGLEVSGGPAGGDGVLRGRFIQDGRKGTTITLSMDGERMAGQFSLSGVRYRLRAGPEQARLYAIDQDELPPPAQPRDRLPDENP